MCILALEIAGLRNLTAQRISPGPRGNAFFGPNGAGKTSLLEAVFLLSRGRSFRATSFESAISYGASRAVVAAILDKGEAVSRLGVERMRDGAIHARVDGVDLNNASSLARQLPCHLLDSSTIAVAVGAPKIRRQLLDWGVFHVEPQFAALSREFRHVLGQRNSSLQLADERQLGFWSGRFVELSQRVHAVRARYVTALVAEFQEMLRRLDAPPIEVRYRSGWSQERALVDVLTDARESELRVGRTLYGPQRADVALTTEGRQLQVALSRGQQKIVAYALVLAQISVEITMTGQAPIVLVDDLLAELDKPHAERVNAVLRDMGVQYFVTSIEADEGTFLAPDESFLMFHVEHGMIHPGHT